MGFDCAVVLLGLTVVDPRRVAWSVLGATVMNLFIAVNHRPRPYAVLLGRGDSGYRPMNSRRLRRGPLAAVLTLPLASPLAARKALRRVALTAAVTCRGSDAGEQKVVHRIS